MSFGATIPQQKLELRHKKEKESTPNPQEYAQTQGRWGACCRSLAGGAPAEDPRSPRGNLTFGNCTATRLEATLDRQAAGGSWGYRQSKGWFRVLAF